MKCITDYMGWLFCGIDSVADLLYNSPSIKAIIIY